MTRYMTCAQPASVVHWNTVSIPRPTLSYPATECPRPEEVTTHAKCIDAFDSSDSEEKFSPKRDGQTRPYRATPALPPMAHPNSSFSLNSGTPVRGSSHRWWYASRNRCCPATANTNAKKHTRPHTETRSGTASTKHTTTDRRLSNRVMVRNGRNARSARSARNAEVCVAEASESEAFATIASATTPPYPTTTRKKSNRFHGSRAYFLAPATAQRNASSTVKKTFNASSSVSRFSFQDELFPDSSSFSSGRYSASETQLQKMAKTTSASKSSCSTTRAANRRNRFLVLANRRRGLRHEDLRAEDLPPPCSLLFLLVW